ncbi:DUF3433 domain-containing protein [Aspergillus glaucus CBS 516.65]|uniref:Uncharacterized protein n=1 Tax=Aspergillus glaucus CBS 516.65 TaxID=1160497 RepID=A0A1L9VKA7_ASPGL|nr:hypothetical protein ASPGLDRAFT_25788 [Aspergillus glaucus CBS 516.65]OJJ84331.1 hypothetical protein ASPGLDRAFT_25788 [Aspergillus glaucus CBS 516.65]
MNAAPQPGNVSLRTVSSSRPQYQYFEQRSEAASDDYYSFPSTASNSASSREGVMRYATPVSGPTSRASSPGVGVPRMGAIGEHGPLLGEETPRRVRARTSRNGNGWDNSMWMEGDLPHIRYAINHLTRDEEEEEEEDAMGQGSAGERPDGFIWDEERGCFTRLGTLPSPSQQQQQQQREPSPSRSVQSSTSSMTTLAHKTFIATDPPENSPLYPPLDYIPPTLRPWALALLILCCLLMIAGVSFCNVWSKKRQGLWDYDGQSGSRYFVFQFLPQILAAILVLWLFVVQVAVYRIMPFAIMASERKLTRVLQNLPLLPRNYLLPDISHFLHGEPLIGFSLFTIWLANFFAIPLLSCIFQVKWYAYTIDGQETAQGRFRWTSVQSIGWTIVSVYGLLTIGLTVLLIRFARAWSGLLWDPTSIADLIPMIQRSNIMHEFEGTETAPDMSKVLEPRVLRLGYWKLSGKKDVLFYGIGEEDAPMHNHPPKNTGHHHQQQQQQQQPKPTDLESNPPTPKTPRWTPWFLRPIPLTIITILVAALYTAFLIASFLHSAIANGFPPRLHTLPSENGFSASNFVYSFVPALIGNIFFLAYQHVDLYFRAVQPYASFSSLSGAPTKHSILLSYPSDLPFIITPKALTNKHFKVAVISLVSTISLSIPILAGGIFTALYYPSDHSIRMTSLMSAFYALVAFCGVYVLSLAVMWPGRKRGLPHGVGTVGEVVSFLYRSSNSLLGDGDGVVTCKEDLVRRVRSGDGDVEARYGFGGFRVERVGREGGVV